MLFSKSPVRRSRFGFIIALTSLATPLSSSADSALEKSPVRIGWIGPITGNAAVLGVDSVPAAELAFAKVNAAGGIAGRTVQLIAEDDQYVAAKAVAAYQKLVHQDKVKVIYVITYGALFALAPRAQTDGVVLIDPLDCDEKIAALPENTFCIAKTTESLGALNADLLMANDDLPSAIIYSDADPFMGTAMQATRDRLKEKGKDFTIIETYNDSTADFRSFLTKIRTNPSIKSVMMYGYDQLGAGFAQARQLGLKQHFYGLNTMTSPGFQKLAGTALEGTQGIGWQPPRNERYSKFLGDFKAKVGREPYVEISTVPSYDIAAIVADALTAGAMSPSGDVLIEPLKKHLLSLKRYDGLSGPITIDPDGITRSMPIYPKIFRNGALHTTDVIKPSGDTAGSAS